MFTEGCKKPAGSGMKKGQKISRTKIKDALKVETYLLEQKLNPVKELINLIPTMTLRDQAETWKYLLQFVDAKVREKIVEDKEDNTLEENILTEIDTDKLIKLAKESV